MDNTLAQALGYAIHEMGVSESLGLSGTQPAAKGGRAPAPPLQPTGGGPARE